MHTGGSASQNILYGNYGEDKGFDQQNGGVNQRVVMMSHVPISNISNLGN